MAEIKEACEDIGGKFDEREGVCKVEDYDAMAEDVLSCIRDKRKEVRVSDSFYWGDHYDSCVAETVSKVPAKVEFDEDKLYDTVDTYVYEEDPSAELVIHGHIPDWAKDAEDYGFGYPLGDGGFKVIISDYYKPAHFDVKFHKVDPWRGYYETVSDGEYVRVSEDAILHFHPSERDLEDFYYAMADAVEDVGGTLVASFERTSNVFSTGMTLFVDRGTWRDHKGDIERVLNSRRD